MEQQYTPDATARLVQDLERSSDLLRYEIGGWSAWPVVRFRVIRSLLRVPFDARPAAPPAELPLYRTALADLRRWPLFRRAEVVAKTYTTARSELVDGRWSDVFFDDLLDDVGGHYKIESINNVDMYLAHRGAARISSDMTTTALMALAGRLGRLERSRTAALVGGELAALLRRELGEGMPSAASIEDALRYFHWLRILYTGLLRRLRPRVVLVADAGEYAVCAAARACGIPVYEFQHGIANRHQPGYCWTSYALPYRERMPIADRLLLYGQHWADELSTGGFWSPDQLRPVGSLRVDRYRGSRRARDGEPLSILLTTQGTDTERLIAFVGDFARQATGRLDFRMAIKLHPVYDVRPELYLDAFAGDPRIEIVPATSSTSTLRLLADADLHVSIFSFCHYEALGLGVPTVLLPLAGHEHVQHLVEAGHALMADSADALVEIARTAGRTGIPAAVSRRYFAPDALENIEREVGLTTPGRRTA